MTTSKPSIVLIPGAWHRPKHYSPLLDALSSAGYDVHGVNLRSVGAPTPVKDLGPDVAAVNEVVEPLVEQGKEVIAIMHSFGGIIGTESLGAFGKKAREAEGKKGGVTKLVYMTAYIPPLGGSVLDEAGGELPEVFIQQDGYLWLPEAGVTRHLLFEDVDDEQAEEVMASLESHTISVFKTGVSKIGYKDIPSYYIFCEKDNALPISAQQAMVQRARETIEVTTEALECGHSPFLVMPQETARIIRKWAGEDL